MIHGISTQITAVAPTTASSCASGPTRTCHSSIDVAVIARIRIETQGTNVSLRRARQAENAAHSTPITGITPSG